MWYNTVEHLYYTNNKETKVQKLLPKTVANSFYIIASGLFPMPLITKQILASQSARISATLTNAGSLRPISHWTLQASSIGPNPTLQLAHLATTTDASNINKTSSKNNGATH